MSFEGIWWHNFTILTPQGIPRADDNTSLSFQSEQAAANPLNLCIRHIKITILYRIPVFSVGFFTFDGGWGNSFPFFKVTKFLSLYESTCCVIIGHFTTAPTLNIE